MEHTRHFLEVKNSLKPSNDVSSEKVQNPINDSNRSMNERQKKLLKRCLKMMAPSLPPISKLTLSDAEVV